MKISVIKSNPELDPSHPDSKLDHGGKPEIIFLKLVRKFGVAKGFRLFGLMMSMALDTGAEGLLDNKQIWLAANDLKEIGLAPKNLNPSELTDLSKRLFEKSLGLGMTAGRVAHSLDNESESEPETGGVS